MFCAVIVLVSVGWLLHFLVNFVCFVVFWWFLGDLVGLLGWIICVFRYFACVLLFACNLVVLVNFGKAWFFVVFGNYLR